MIMTLLSLLRLRLFFLFGRPRPQLKCVNAAFRCHLVFQEAVDHPVARGLHFGFEGF